MMMVRGVWKERKRIESWRNECRTWFLFPSSPAIGCLCVCCKSNTFSLPSYPPPLHHTVWMPVHSCLFATPAQQTRFIWLSTSEREEKGTTRCKFINERNSHVKVRSLNCRNTYTRHTHRSSARTTSHQLHDGSEGKERRDSCQPCKSLRCMCEARREEERFTRETWGNSER